MYLNLLVSKLVMKNVVSGRLARKASQERKVLTREENVLVPDEWTDFFSSPELVSTSFIFSLTHSDGYCFPADPGSKFSSSPILIPPRTSAQVWCTIHNATYLHSLSFYMQTKRHQQFYFLITNQLDRAFRGCIFSLIVTFLATSLLQRHSGILK